MEPTLKRLFFDSPDSLKMYKEKINKYKQTYFVSKNEFCSNNFFKCQDLSSFLNVKELNKIDKTDSRGGGPKKPID